MQLSHPFSTYQFKVEVLTPTHVGMAQEKHYQRGLDFVVENGDLCLLDVEQLYRDLTTTERDSLLSKLAAGQSDPIEKYLRERNLIRAPYLRRRIKLDGTHSMNDPVRRLYADGMGHYALPGSAIKGAMRSIIWNRLKSRHGMRTPERALFGDITSNLMRMVRVFDVAFPDEAVKVYPTKTFSADGGPIPEHEGYGKWKDGNPGRHNARFQPDGFVTYYEALRTKTTGELRVQLGNQASGALRNHLVQHVPNYREFLQPTTGPQWVGLLREYAKRHLEKEKQYFKTFPNDALGETIQARLNGFLKQNDEPDSCLLRVGAGVGFHSITGGWQDVSKDHVSAWVDEFGEVYSAENEPVVFSRELKSRRNHDQIFSKTRKFILAKNPEGKYLFLPMGYLKLTLLP